MEDIKAIIKLIQSSTYIVELQDGSKGIWKVYSTDSSPLLRNEITAYEINQILDLDLVPEMERKQFMGIFGLLREHIEGQTVESTDVKVNEKSLQKLAIFDYLILHIDRGMKNIIVTPNGECVGIDSKATFARTDGVSFNIGFCMGVELYDETKELIKKISEQKDTIKDTLTKQGYREEIINGVRRRIVTLESIVKIKDTIYSRFGTLTTEEYCEQ